MDRRPLAESQSVAPPKIIPFFNTEQSHSEVASARYLRELGVELKDTSQKIQFGYNGTAPIHRWAPYIQGFSATFVSSILERYIQHGRKRKVVHVHDPFAGCGTVLVQTKLSGLATSTGTELNPMLAFVTRVKLDSWTVSSDELIRELKNLTYRELHPYPQFIDTERHFEPAVLRNLQLLRNAIEKPASAQIRDLFRVAFASILIDCSRLRRTPCLGYDQNKVVPSEQPFVLFSEKIYEMAADLQFVKEHRRHCIDVRAEAFVTDARDYKPPKTYLAITSPPYMNGLDYVINYKIEMAWLGFTESQEEAKQLKNKMVACDNISKEITRQFKFKEERYNDPWLEEILEKLDHNVKHWGEEQKSLRIQRQRTTGNGPTMGYRRSDMPVIVHKYFDDMNPVMRRVGRSLDRGGRFILVVGDSYIADTYVPTDLILAKMGIQAGLNLESIEKARNRHSGQIRSYRLRESIVTLRKPS